MDYTTLVIWYVCMYNSMDQQLHRHEVRIYIARYIGDNARQMTTVVVAGHGEEHLFAGYRVQHHVKTFYTFT